METTIDQAITPELQAELQAAADRAVNGERTPDDMRKAAAALEILREENGRRFGIQNIVVPILRESRGYPPET